MYYYLCWLLFHCPQTGINYLCTEQVTGGKWKPTRLLISVWRKRVRTWARTIQYTCVVVRNKSSFSCCRTQLIFSWLKLADGWRVQFFGYVFWNGVSPGQQRYDKDKNKLCVNLEIISSDSNTHTPNSIFAYRQQTLSQITIYDISDSNKCLLFCIRTPPLDEQPLQSPPERHIGALKGAHSSHCPSFT